MINIDLLIYIKLIMEKQFYLVLLHYGSEDSSKVVISLDRVDFFLSRGYTVEFVQPIRVLSDKL